MGDHTPPGRHQPHPQPLGAEVGPQDADPPHPYDVVKERGPGPPHPHHHPLHHDGDTVQRLRDGHHPQHRGPQVDDLPAGGEKPHQRPGRQEKGPAGETHQNHLDGEEHGGDRLHPAAVPGAVGLACQGGGGGLHPVAGDVEGRLHRVGDGVGRRGHRPQGVDHRRKGDVSQGGAKPLEHIGQGDAQAGAQDGPVRPEAPPPGRDHRMPPEGSGDLETAPGEGHGAGGGSPHHPHPRPGEGDTVSPQTEGAGGVDEKKIQQNIDTVDDETHLHGGLGVPRRPEGRPQDGAGGPGQHGEVEDQEVSGGHRTDRFLQLHPAGDEATEGGGKEGADAADDQYREHRLGGGTLGGVRVLGTAGFGDHGQKADGKGPDGTADEPADGGSCPHRRRGLGAQGAHHGGIDVLDCGLHHLLQHGGPGQGPDEPQGFSILPALVHLLHRPASFFGNWGMKRPPHLRGPSSDRLYRRSHWSC